MYALEPYNAQRHDLETWFTVAATIGVPVILPIVLKEGTGLYSSRIAWQDPTWKRATMSRNKNMRAFVAAASIYEAGKDRDELIRAHEADHDA